MALSEAVTHCIYPIWICQSASLESSDSLKPGVCMKTLTVSWKWHSSGSQPAQLISERNGKEQELQILQLRCNSLALENRDEDSLYFESNCWVCTKSISGYMINIIIFPLWVLIPDGSQLPLWKMIVRKQWKDYAEEKQDTMKNERGDPSSTTFLCIVCILWKGGYCHIFLKLLQFLY